MSSIIRSSFVATALVAAAVALAGCSAIRVVKANKAGGEIALLGNREDAMTKAGVEMNRICGAHGFEVVEEGEAVIGTHSTSEEQAVGGRTFFGAPAVKTTGSTDTVQKTEWRVKYICKGVDQPAAPSAAPPAAPMPVGKIHELIVRF